MLVLSRHRDESVIIGREGEISVLIVDIRGDKVRLGVEAPREIPIHRKEVYDAIHRGEKVPEKNIPQKGLEKVANESRTSSAELHQQYVDYLQAGDLQEAYHTVLVSPNILSQREAYEFALKLGSELYKDK